MISKGSQVAEQPSWSSQSASPSPPPAPLPPPVVARWARAEQSSAESCPHCRGRLASLPTRTTSLSSYSACKGKKNAGRKEREEERKYGLSDVREGGNFKADEAPGILRVVRTRKLERYIFFCRGGPQLSDEFAQKSIQNTPGLVTMEKSLACFVAIFSFKLS